MAIEERPFLEIPANFFLEAITTHLAVTYEHCASLLRTATCRELSRYWNSPEGTEQLLPLDCLKARPPDVALDRSQVQENPMRNELLTIDGIVNLVLGILLVAFPANVVHALGLLAGDNAF